MVGDAGHHKDFVSSDGISEALISARAAAAAILVALGAATEPDAALALERFWRERDVAALPLYFHARDLAEPNGNGTLDRAVLNAVQAGPAGDRERFAEIFSRAVSPYEVLSPARVLRIAASRIARGELSVVREFVDRAKRNLEVSRELQRRRALLDALPEARGLRRRSAAARPDTTRDLLGEAPQSRELYPTDSS